MPTFEKKKWEILFASEAKYKRIGILSHRKSLSSLINDQQVWKTKKKNKEFGEFESRTYFTRERT